MALHASGVGFSSPKKVDLPSKFRIMKVASLFAHDSTCSCPRLQNVRNDCYTKKHGGYVCLSTTQQLRTFSAKYPRLDSQRRWRSWRPSLLPDPIVCFVLISFNIQLWAAFVLVEGTMATWSTILIFSVFQFHNNRRNLSKC